MERTAKMWTAEKKEAYQKLIKEYRAKAKARGRKTVEKKMVCI